MRHLTKLASKLYPRWWRERYGDEFAALLEDAKPGFRGTLDILKGALAMQLSTSSALKAVLVCAIVGVVGGIAVTYFLTPQYSSHAVLSMSTPEGALNLDAGKTINRYSNVILNRTTLTALVMKLDLYPNERSKLPVMNVLELMKQHIQISAIPAEADGRAVPAFQIAFQYPDRAAAKKVVNSLVGNYMDENLHRSPESGGLTMEVLGPASEPTDPVFPRRKSFAVAGLGAGVLLGGLAALVLHFRRRRQLA